MYVYFDDSVLYQFVNECETGEDLCGECTWHGGKNQWSMIGSLSIDDCLKACWINELCNYASRNALGSCHLSHSCSTQSGSGWSRYKKGLIIIYNRCSILYK